MPAHPSAPPQAIRGALLDFVGDPFEQAASESVRYFSDGLLVLERGHVKAVGEYASLKEEYSTLDVIDHSGKLIVPGFIDLHIHYPQTEIIAAYGEQLLEWLNKYVFPVEAKFQEETYAEKVAAFFLDELLRNGTTTAVVFTTIFPQSVDALFAAAQRRTMRLIAGQVLMDRHAPDFLVKDAYTADQENRELIQKWHGKGRSLYAITPRFAITSTPTELQYAGKLKAEVPDLYVHTHLSENKKEVEAVAELFPDSTDYLNVYEQFGLVGDRTIFAHCVQLTDSAFQRLSTSGAAIAFCPTSNLFLGSGLFNLARAKSADSPVKVGLATDVGAGTSFSMLQTMSDAYKIMQLQGQSLSAFQAFYLATLGAAKALSLDDKLGSFAPGKEADFVVLDLQATPLLAFRNPGAIASSLEALADPLFALMMLGDDRAVQATYVAGERQYSATHLIGR